MYLNTNTFAIVAALVCQAAAHGYVPTIIINGKSIPGWDVSKDGYTTPQPLRVVRATKPDSGFIADPKSGDITCSIGNSKLPPGPITATVAAGGTVTAQWNTWPTGHYGPVLNYMAKCPSSGCSSWKADTGSPWFKIQQSVYTNGEWASDTLAKGGFKYDVHIPKNIAPGDYILRHENLALHGASNIGGAQFYPVCIQLTVTGGGSLSPSGLSFPGAYSATDPGIHFNPYQGDAANKAYVPPGGPVYSGLQF
ncbi:endoglucanase-4 [Crepidotus variabilis]|uniref:lytic cellulose monooxygenase (C4-dehydrogenating) n=1 Tax=Crepidotus variabilis TaxID=179855 RepID=A0A9P6JSA6_9AGAR|nr:endoglucanase-4 [Crepidotus variabilis]